MKTSTKLFITIIISAVLILTMKAFSVDAMGNSSTRLVGLGDENVLREGQTAKLIGRDVYITINHFIYSPCPAGARCIWSGLDVVHDLYVNGNKVKADETIYRVIIVKTDYKSYAAIKIEL